MRGGLAENTGGGPGGPDAAASPRSRRFGDRNASNSFPPRRLSFDKLRTAIEALVASTEIREDNMSRDRTPSPVLHAAERLAGDDAASPRSREVPLHAGVGNSHDKARQLVRSGSFPVRRSSFDRILDVIHSNEEQGEPADGPALTNSNTNNTRSSASNSGSSNISGIDSHAKHRVDTVPAEQQHAKSEATSEHGGFTDVECHRPIIADATPGTAGGIRGGKLLAPDHTTMTPAGEFGRARDMVMRSGPHGGPRDDFSRRRNPGRYEGGETDAQNEEGIGHDGFMGAGAADWYQSGDYEDDAGSRIDFPARFKLEDEPDSEILVGHRAAMMRGQSTGEGEIEIEPADFRGRGIGENSTRCRRSIRAESHERDFMHGWNYLLSLVKAKLLANNGRGRKLTIMCGGFLSQTYEKTLRKYPGTLLTSMVLEEDGALFYSDKVYLDRHPLAFVEILNAYREGVIAEQPVHIAPETWIHELVHFRMHRAKIPVIEDLLERYGIHTKKVAGKDPLLGLSRGAVLVYNFLEEPTSSWPAWMLSVVSLSMIVLSIVLVCIETLPEIQADTYTVEILGHVELGIVIFFTVEYLARFLVASRKRDFLLTFMNNIDLVAIVPTYVILAVPSLSQLGVAKLFRIMRVLRIFKLSRHSNGLQVLAKTGMACKHELGLLLFCLLVFSLLFSAVLFFAEEEVGSAGFESIPHTMWWAVVTVTTVGYGDLAPETTLGRIMGSLCAVMGVVMVALPISVISSTFNEKFREHNKGIQVRARREEQRRVLSSKLRAMFFSTQGRGWGSREETSRKKSFEWPSMFNFSRPSSMSSFSEHRDSGLTAVDTRTRDQGTRDRAQTPSPPGSHSGASLMSVSPKSATTRPHLPCAGII